MQETAVSDGLTDTLVDCFMAYAQELDGHSDATQEEVPAPDRLAGNVASLVRVALNGLMQKLRNDNWDGGSSSDCVCRAVRVENLADTIATTLHVVLATLGGDVWAQPVVNCIAVLFKEHAVASKPITDAEEPDGAPASQMDGVEREAQLLQSYQQQQRQQFAYRLVLCFLRGMNYRGTEHREDILTALFASCELPPALKTDVLLRWKIRRNQLLCKSVAPRCALQVPSTTSHLVELLYTFMSGYDTPAPSESAADNINETATEDAAAGGRRLDAAWVQKLQQQLYRLLAASHIHHRFLAVVVLRAVVARHHLEMAAASAACTAASATQNTVRVRPPLCALFDDNQGLLRLVVETLQETAVNAFCDALPEDAAAARRAPLLLFAHGFFSMPTAMACYFGSLLYGPGPAVADASQVATANFEGCLQRAAKFSMELDAYVSGTYYESALETTLFGGGGRGAASAAAAAKRTANANGVSMNGELPQASFFRVVHKAPAPSWNDLLSKAEAKAIPWRTFPISLLQELLNLRLYDAASQYITDARRRLHVDVFAYRGDAIDGGEAHTRIIDHVEGRLQAIASTAVQGGELQSGMATRTAASVGSSAMALRRAICEMLPLLKAAQTYLGSVRFLWALMRSAVAAWADPAAAMGQLRELIVAVVLPCFRVVVPSPPLYHVLHQLFETMQTRTTIAAGGSSALLSAKELLAVGAVPRMPHDALHFKALDAAFNSSIKRMTLETAPEYMAATINILYSNPIHVIEKLFQQAVGYENAQATTHAQLLTGAPKPILKMFLVIGLHLMRRYAAEERDGAENRVAIIASFICIVWRVNPATFDGAFALREVERSFRRPARESLVFGNEFLKAALLQLTSTVCEYEEQYNPEQLTSLGCIGAASTWCGRGAAASFLGRWHPRLFNAEILEQSRQTLRSALNSPLYLQQHEAGHAPTTPLAASSASVGNAILLHLAALDCTVYDILGDISGTMESVLNQCAKQHNILNDVMFALAPMVDAPPTMEELGVVTLPAIALKLVALATRRRQYGDAAAAAAAAADGTLVSSFRRHFLEPMTCTASAACDNEDVPDKRTDVASVDDDDVIPLEVQCTLAGLQAYHLEFNAATYAKAKSEAEAVVRRAQHDSTASKAAKGMLAASRTWAASLVASIAEECALHEAVQVASTSFVDAFLCHSVLPCVVRDPSALVRRCIVPRVLLSLEDAVATAALLRRLLRCAAASSDTEHRRVVDLLLLTVSTVVALFVSLTDGECKRCGSLLAAILQMLDDDVQSARHKDIAAVGASLLASPQQVQSPVSGDPPSSAAVANDAAANKTDGAAAAARELLERSRTFVGTLHATCLDAWIPAYVLDCDAYLAQAFYQILSGAPKDVPQFCFRNAFIILDRIKASFPRTPEAAAVMLAAVRYHNDKTSAYFAAATAQMKLYLSVIALQKGNVSGSYMKHLLADLNEAIARETDLAASTEAEIGALDAEQAQQQQEDAPAIDDDDEQLQQQQDAADDDGSVGNGEEEAAGGSDDDNESVASSNSSGCSGNSNNSSSESSILDEDIDVIDGAPTSSTGEEQIRSNKRPRDEEQEADAASPPNE